MVALEYPITRPYPWRWTTLVVCIGGALVFAGLGLINFVAIGYNSQPFYYDEFRSSTPMSWRNKLDINYAQTNGIRCEPNHISVGGIYRTKNAIFALNVENVRDPITTAPLGSANYSGDALDSCRVTRIYMMAEFATHEATFRAQVACRSPSLFANFTVESVATLRSGVPNGIVTVDTLGALENEQSRPEAVATALLYALGIDVLASIFFFPPPVPSSSSTTNGSASSLWAEWDPLAPHADIPMVLSGLASTTGDYFQSKDASGFQDLGPPALQALQNYAIGLHDAILLDVGSTVAGYDKNILTNLTALQTRIQTPDLLETFMTPTNGTANGVDLAAPAMPFVLSHTDEFRLPLSARRVDGSSGDPGPVTLVQRYLCYRLVLKPTMTLAVDVLVATVSMFMVVWGIVMFVLMYVAKGHTINGNCCSCPTCDTYRRRSFPAMTRSLRTVSTSREPDSTDQLWSPYFDSPGPVYHARRF